MATYLFSWDDLSTKAEARFKDFLIKKYHIDWVNNAKLEKIDDGKTIQVASGGNSLFLVLNDKKTEATLIICDGKIDKLKVAEKNGKLNIYNEIHILCPSCKKDFLEDLEKELRCKNCGYFIEKPKSAPSAPVVFAKSMGLVIIYIIPLIFIYGIMIIIYYYILRDIYRIFFY